MSKMVTVLSAAICLVAAPVSTAYASRMMGGGMMGDGKMCSMMGRMPKTGVDPENLPDAASPEARTYAKFCSQCHPLPSPKRNSAKDWKALVERMDSRMRMMSGMGGGMMGMMKMMMGRGRVEPMTAAEKEAVIGYLEKNALKALDRSKTASLDTPEYKTFERICSQCHEPPDPSIHTKSEWPRVVRKMEENIREAGVEAPTSEEKKLLLEFLRRNTSD
ncbi:MAG: hypothetical protein ACNS63_09925 [Candidatus Nitrospinota bacterium M3_3B_026]